MYLCYIDESGTPDIPGNTSHFVLTSLSIPVEQWKNCDTQIRSIKKRYGLESAEIHVAWMMRPYLEQNRIPGFAAMDYSQRSYQMNSARTAELLRLQRSNLMQYKQTKKNYKATESYIHLTLQDRQSLVREVATCISGWTFARLFAECIDKVHYDPLRARKTVDEQAFEQVVSRFEAYLQNINRNAAVKSYGLLIHDNNETVARKHTNLMKHFYETGTLWRGVNNIVETPLFVNSELTGMVQIADLCSYALRRYLENKEDTLFDVVFHRADRIGGTVVGVRHFTNQTPPCTCKICNAHNTAP